MSVFGSDSIFERRVVREGQVVVLQNEAASEAFLIQSGSVRVYATDAGGVRVDLGILGPGEIFGEMAILAGGLRNASVEALEQGTLVVINRDTLDLKLKKSDPTMRAIMQMLLKRLRQGNAALLYRASNVDELLETVNAIYGNFEQSLPPMKRHALEALVKPKIDELMAAVVEFKRKNV
jgi:CRP/FNR family cyclic AMP-dependent transcriptional regulator